jgi:hypothetical protein
MVYDDGGLPELVGTFAHQELIDRADFPDEWAASTMGGYRFDCDDDGCVAVTDLATDERIQLLDLGAGFEHWPGQHLLGRVVPTSCDPGRMFEWRPLPVNEATARAVADSPQHGTTVLSAASRARELSKAFSLMEDGTDVLTDVCARPWTAGLNRKDIARLPVVDGTIDHRDVAILMLERFVAAAATCGTVFRTLRPVLFSLVLHPGLEAHIRSRLCRPEHQTGWQTKVACLPEPARARCSTYARQCLDVA